MTGTLTLPHNRYLAAGGGLNCNNSDIVNANAIYCADASTSHAEGINFYVDGNSWDSIYIKNHVLVLSINNDENIYTVPTLRSLAYSGTTNNNGNIRIATSRLNIVSVGIDRQSTACIPLYWTTGGGNYNTYLHFTADGVAPLVNTTVSGTVYYLA